MKPIFPQSADLRVEAACPAKDPFGLITPHCKPIPTDAIVTDAVASAQYDAAVESWGQRGWNAVARLCRWAAANGDKDAPACPAPQETPQ